MDRKRKPTLLPMHMGILTLAAASPMAAMLASAPQVGAEAAEEVVPAIDTIGYDPDSLFFVDAEEATDTVGQTPIINTSLVKDETGDGRIRICAPGERESDARSVFVNLPVNVLDIIQRNVREDMVSYYTQRDSIWEAPNVMGGESQLITAGRDYLKAQISPASTLQIRMLPYKGDTIVMTIYTVGVDGKAPDSDVRFFSSTLKELERKRYFAYPELKDFLEIEKGDKKMLGYLEQLVAFPTYEFNTGAESTTLSGTLTVGEYMTDEAYAKLKEHIRKDGMRYEWTGSKFRPFKTGK